MNEPEKPSPEDQPGNQPENKPDPPVMPDYELLQRHIRDRRRTIPRQSIHESIAGSRSTLLTNLIIEIAAGLVLLLGIVYALVFLYQRRAYLDPGRFKLYLEVITFFSLAWFTYVGFKVRKKYRALRNYGRRPDDPENS